MQQNKIHISIDIRFWLQQNSISPSIYTNSAFSLRPEPTWPVSN